MLILNLGSGVPGHVSHHPIGGAVNLDRSTGWRLQDGLPYATGSVAAITISHLLMYVPIADWPAAFTEFARVLGDGGVIRITEDETSDKRSARYGGWRGSEPAITLTYPALIGMHLERAGLSVVDVTPESSNFADGSLIQQWHGEPPDVFHCEGMRMTRVLFAPHNDDETLFAAFSILTYRPRVVVCFKSSGDYGDSAVREAETRDAMAVLGGDPVEQWDGGDLRMQMIALDLRVKPSLVLAPNRRASHPDHIAVAEAAVDVFGDRVKTYHTYDEHGKVAPGATGIAIEPGWTEQKLRALARYSSQINHPRANRWFMNDLWEYVE